MSLPPGFDVTGFVTEYATVCLPFVSIACLFAAYRLITKAFKLGGK